MLYRQMPAVISIANQKGGAGKTTVTMNLAGGLHEAGYRVLVIDADPQQSATKWRNRQEENQLGFDIISMARPGLHKDLPGMNLDYEIILIDCPPGLADASGQGGITIGAVLASQFVLVPVQPTFLDYEASQMVLPLLQQVAAFRPDLQALIVVNRKPTNRSRLATEAREAAVAFFTSTEVSIRVLQAELSDRTAYKESPGTGQTILRYEPGSKGAEEVRQLTMEVLECLRVPARA